MSEIKNLHLLKTFTPEQVTTLETRALLHRRHAHIYFKVLAADADSVTVKVSQEKPFGDVAPETANRLAQIAKELFADFLPPAKVKAQAAPFVRRPVDDVTPEWVQRKMAETGTDLRTLANDTGVDKTTLSGSITGGRGMSAVTRAMFYLYFLNKASAATTS